MCGRACAVLWVGMCWFVFECVLAYGWVGVSLIAGVCGCLWMWSFACMCMINPLVSPKCPHNHKIVFLTAFI